MFFCGHEGNKRLIAKILHHPGCNMRPCLQSFVINHTRKRTDTIQVEPGKPGAEVSKKKNYKSKKEFAYRMCTG